MRFWFTFGVGMVLGTVFGFFVASFLLFDDKVPDRSRRAGNSGPHPVAVAAAHPVQPQKQAAQPAKTDSKPIAVAAEAVDLNALPAAPAEAVPSFSTAKRDIDSQEIQPAR